MSDWQSVLAPVTEASQAPGGMSAKVEVPISHNRCRSISMCCNRGAVSIQDGEEAPAAVVREIAPELPRTV